MTRRILIHVAALVYFAAAATCAEYPQTTAPVTIPDPSFNGMPAVTMNVPAGWKLEGTIMTSPCNTLPWPVFRSYSADGLSEFRVMPVFGWRWAANPRYLMNGGCLPLTGRMTAAEFLAKFVELIPGGVHVVGPMAVDATFHDRAQHFADQVNNGPNLMPAVKGISTADTAALRIETVNGTFVIEQRLRVQLECLERSSPAAGALQGGNCWARVDVARAPKGRLDALVALVDGKDLIKNTPSQQWMSAVLARQQQQGQAAMAALQRQQAAAAAMLKQQHDQFMSTMQRNHEAFMAQQEARFQSSMRNANAAMNARSTAASDWVDYALDQQTVTGQGGTVKVSSGYTHVWSNGQNEWYQTNDPNANPNGVLSGNWTEDRRVHGNGSPY
jgi:hypothetical protein